MKGKNKLKYKIEMHSIKNVLSNGRIKESVWRKVEKTGNIFRAENSCILLFTELFETYLIFCPFFSLLENEGRIGQCLLES